MLEETRSFIGQPGIDNLGRKKTNIILIILFTAIISSFFLLFLLTPSSSAQNTSDVDANELIALTNTERAARGLPTLAIDPLLKKAAEKKLADIFKNQYFNHNAPDGTKFSAWVKEAGYTYTIVGENLAMGFGTNEQIINAWMDSPKHRENILKGKYKDIGIAIAKGKLDNEMVTVVVQYFGASNIIKLSELLIPYQNISINLTHIFTSV